MEISGYSRDELIGKNHSLLNSHNQPKSYWQDMYKTVSNGNIWKDQVKNIAKNGSYYWVDSALWTPLGGKSPRYTISSKLAVVSGWVGFEEKIPFQDENGSAISMTGAWSFFLDIEDYGTSSSNPGSFYCNFSGYNNPTKMRNPQTNTTIVSPLGVPLKSEQLAGQTH